MAEDKKRLLPIARPLTIMSAGQVAVELDDMDDVQIAIQLQGFSPAEHELIIRRAAPEMKARIIRLSIHREELVRSVPVNTLRLALGGQGGDEFGAEAFEIIPPRRLAEVFKVSVFRTTKGGQRKPKGDLAIDFLSSLIEFVPKRFLAFLEASDQGLVARTVGTQIRAQKSRGFGKYLDPTQTHTVAAPDIADEYMAHSTVEGSGLTALANEAGLLTPDQLIVEDERVRIVVDAMHEEAPDLFHRMVSEFVLRRGLEGLQGSYDSSKEMVRLRRHRDGWRGDWISFLARIRTLVARQHLAPEDLEQIFDWPPQVVVGMLKGECRPNPSHLTKLWQVLYRACLEREIAVIDQGDFVVQIGSGSE